MMQGINQSPTVFKFFSKQAFGIGVGGSGFVFDGNDNTGDKLNWDGNIIT